MRAHVACPARDMGAFDVVPLPGDVTAMDEDLNFEPMCEHLGLGVV
jgi:hypothetical protein